MVDHECVVAREVAEIEFDRFCEAMDLDVDASRMDEDDRGGLEKLRAKFVRSIMRGILTLDEEGIPTVHLQCPVGDVSKVMFPEPTGDTLLAMDKGKQNQNVGKMFSMMGAMTSNPPHVFAKMKKRDLDVCTAVTQLFLS
jgi:hypothetical protein